MRPVNSPADSPATASLKPEARSRVSNGKTLFLDRVDGRSRAARRFRDLLADFLDKTHGRHADVCRALAAMCVQREGLEAKIARGEAIDTDLLLRLSSEIRRSQERLGLIAATADDEPDEDGTPQAIANLRAQFEAAP